ncbi:MULTISPECIES: M15 family metallopeptidase [Streptomyces]|uniref:M15 family metallopeptidase n=1 Tax=Streptomyces TaxID=1883 RepID=UPI00099FA875|nr:M15 family metallopeptidase [Streptomyces qinglanensis]
MFRFQSPAGEPPLRARRLTAAGLTAVVAAAAVTAGGAAVLTPRVSQSAPLSPAASSRAATPATASASASGPPAAAPPDSTPPRGGPGGGVGAADGVVPDGVTVFDDTYPAVAELDPQLLKALRRAAKDAASRGVTFHVNSGWRSPAYQNDLLRQAVARYGSAEEAARWVATAATSPHVAGKAVDVGGSRATEWLSRHGAAYGLCRIYENEPWHYELRTGATTGGCPRRYADPTRDPRMRQ